MANLTSNTQKYKIVLLGDQSVGKTSILNRFIYDAFEGKEQPTIGIDFISKQISVDNQQIRLQLWDTAGQERFRSLIPNYIRNINAAIIVFDISNKQSFDSVQKWIDDVKQQNQNDFGGSDCIICLVGNKSDLQNRQVDNESAIQLAKDHNFVYIEVSALKGLNINSLFQIISSQLLGLEINMNQQSVHNHLQHNNIQLQPQTKNISSNIHKKSTHNSCC